MNMRKLNGNRMWVSYQMSIT